MRPAFTHIPTIYVVQVEYRDLGLGGPDPVADIEKAASEFADAYPRDNGPVRVLAMDFCAETNAPTLCRDVTAECIEIVRGWRPGNATWIEDIDAARDAGMSGRDQAAESAEDHWMESAE